MIMGPSSTGAHGINRERLPEPGVSVGGSRHASPFAPVWQPRWAIGGRRVSVVDWLLDSDPAIRWQVMRGLTHEPADVVAGERSGIASVGWGAHLLALQGPDGLWGGGTLFPEWTSTTHTLLVLRYMGLDPA